MITSCKRAAELISRSLETPLRWHERLALGAHLCICAMCRRYRRQSHVLDAAARCAAGTLVPSSDAALSEAARDRIRQALRGRANGVPPPDFDQDSPNPT